MKWYKDILLSIFFLLALISCYEEPEFPLEPYLIDFDGEEGVKFVDVPNTIADSLIIRVRFQDGNGDLGLVSNEVDPTLREQYFFPLDEEGDYIVYDPEVDGAYDCTRFKIPPTYIGLDTIRDTIQVELNPYYYNFEVGLYIKEDGVFLEFDFLRDLCRPRLGGRFPPLKEDFSNTKPIEGILQYGFASAGIRSLFLNDTLKLTVQIKDRALNLSNVIESRPFVLVSDGSIYVEE